jgi:integrase/recombinase XerD
MELTTFEALFRAFLRFYGSESCEDPKKPGTLGNYEKKYRKITAWLQCRQLASLDAEAFSIALAKELLRDMLSRYGRNYSVRMVKMVGQVLQWGINEGLIREHPLKHMTLKRDGKKKIVHLTPEEVSEIAGWNFRSAMLTKIRDIFVLACYTGFDYGCSMRVCRQHLVLHTDGRHYLVKPRDKAIGDKVNEAVIPLHPHARGILERYGWLMPRIANGSYNRCLKEIMWIMGFEKKVSTHTARKTFAMIMLNWELYSIEAVSKMLGHTLVKTTEESYAQVNITRISRELDQRQRKDRAA